MGNLGSAVLGFLTFLLLMPARSGTLLRDCVHGQSCPDITHCYTWLGWQDVLGPLSCSRWAAASIGLLVSLGVRTLGKVRSLDSR